MGFFDLNIPYYESDKQIADKSTKKTNRLKLVIKSMELGYSGVAYNRTMKGVMSESERCDTSLFPLSSILKLAPSISAAVKFHRELLGVPTSTPFRQYTRLTVVVDSPSQASALNSGNPILKSYDIVAVRPLNQNAFEQACQTSEVDLIAIDFSDKLPFRLKQFAVKAAIERGVYFEIAYSNLLVDPQVKRQMITNSKLLVDWTRGKNLIFSSAAPSVTELRGPNDVANLSSLLGLSIERAKASISKNCRLLIANALRKKNFYKEAIRVEVIPSVKQFDTDSGFKDWLKWDPLSSGDGDLQLDEIEKALNDSKKSSHCVKAIDFSSVVDSLPPNGLQIKDLIPTTKTLLDPPDVGKNLSKILEKDCEEPKISIGEEPNISIGFDVETDTQDLESRLGKNSSVILELAEEPKISIGFDVETDAHDLKSSICVTNYETDLIMIEDDDNETVDAILPDTEIPEDSMQNEEESERVKTSNFIDEQSTWTHNITSLDTEIGSVSNNFVNTETLAPSNNVSMEIEEPKCLDLVLVDSGMNGNLDLSSPKEDLSLNQDFPELPFSESFVAMENNTESPVANTESQDEVAVKNKMGMDEDTVTNSTTSLASLSGKVRGKRRTSSHGVSLFPFKRLLSHAPLKKKARKVKRKL